MGEDYEQNQSNIDLILMQKMITKLATVAVAGAMTLGAMAPIASASTHSNSYYVYGGNGLSGNNLGQLFVLGALFGGPYGNGVIGPYGTSLGDLLILNQIFHNGGM